MTDTPVRELPHVVLTFRCGCRLNLAIEADGAKADYAQEPCRRHLCPSDRSCTDLLLPAKLVRIEFHRAHDRQRVEVPVIYP